MNGDPADEQLLGQFRQWLTETRQEAARSENEPNHSPTLKSRVGLDRLVEEFTALRHEIKLQTRGSRDIEERLESALTSLDDAAKAFRAAPVPEPRTSAPAPEKPLIMALIELDESLDRGRKQWEKSSVTIIDGPADSLVAQLDALYAGLSWWQRRFSWLYHREARQAIEAHEQQQRQERQSLINVLMDGQGLIQQRLKRSMANAGVLRIRAAGRTVDPEEMVVVEVVDAEGPPGQVLDELRPGYTWQGQVLRPVEVRVIRPRFEADMAQSHDVTGN
jgi:molecular chaperone GrpE